MPLTKDFKETVRARLIRSPGFRKAVLQEAVGGLLALMEPIMIVFLGVVVGGMVVAMYLPIFDMINAVQ